MRSITSQLSGKLNSSQQTPANNADPKMSIKVSRARTTIMDSDYWTVETIREKSGIGDISLTPRRRVPYGTPDRIYEIHVDGGVVKTTIREYPDYPKTGWKPQFELGAGSAVALAFDAHWEMYREKWRTVTEEKPYVFWVDDSGVLWGQLWDEDESRFQLATSVVKVKAIRGWKNNHYPDKDQGLVVAYIKGDGQVYYRNWCQQADYSYLWESEKLISGFTGTAQSVNLFITNDYRIGFAISDALGDVSVFITKRNWSGMALHPENIGASITDLSLDFIPISYIDGYVPENISATIANFDIGMLWAGETLPVNAVNDISEWMQVTGEEVEIGDGTTTDFNLLRTPEQNLVVYLDGVITTDYTMNAHVIQFTTAPGNGVVVTADYYWLNYGKYIKVTMDHGVMDYAGSHGAFVVIDDASNMFYPTAISGGDINGVSPSTFEGTNEVVLTVDINGAVNPLEVQYTTGGIHGEIGQGVSSFTGLNFTAINLKPVIVDPPEVEAIWNE